MLSTRLRQILQLLATGKSAKDIATILGISYKTVQCQQTVILARLQAENSVHAVVIALKRGYIQFPE